MPTSDTSDRRQILWLLVVLGAVLAMAEVGARYLVPRISKIDSRTYSEHRAANEISLHGEGRRTILIVGNSLMRSGIDVPVMQNILRPEWEFRRFIVESTGYLDWYYGLQKLFETGNRPYAVIVMLDPLQLLVNETRGPYSSYWLFSARGALNAGIEAGYHPTEISGMFVGHFSAYYGKRLEIRKVAFQKIVPDALALTTLLLPEPISTNKITTAQIETIGRGHLQRLKELCDSYGIRMIFIVPPTQKPGHIRDDLVDLTNRLGLSEPTLDVQFEPSNNYTGNVWPDRYFDSDHWHFSEQGSKAYTSRLGPALKTYLVSGNR